jgi:hypothetical protein
MSTFVGDSTNARASATHRSPLRSNYYHFHELLDDLQDTDEPISRKKAVRNFMFFETTQSNFQIGDLPSEWLLFFGQYA